MADQSLKGYNVKIDRLFYLGAAFAAMFGALSASFGQSLSDLDYARQSFHNQNYHAMIELTRSAARDGDPDAQNLMGVALESLPESEGTAVEALSWYKKSAAQNYPKAWYNMALLYSTGAGGVSKDTNRAKAAYDQAIKLGYSLAYANRGVLEEQSTPPNYIAAFEFYRKSHEAGHSVGTVNLATLYAKGLGVEVDFDQAKKLFSQAANEGNLRAIRNLGYMYESGSGVTRDLEKAEALYKQGLIGGHIDAGTALFWLYWEAEPPLGNKSKALAYCLKTAELEKGEAKARTQSQCDELMTVMTTEEIANADSISVNIQD